MHKVGPTVRIFGILAVAVLVAAGAAALAKASLPGPAWIPASVVGGLIVVAGFFKPLVGASAEVWTASLKRASERAQTKQEFAELHGGPGGKIRLVRDIRDHALRYGVQQAIPLERDHKSDLSDDLPRYVPRTSDVQLHGALTARSVTGGMVIIKGDSTWGKTRSLLEGVIQVLPKSPIVAPGSAAELAGLVDAGVSISGTVIWLDELKDFLDSNDALSPQTIRRAVNRGAILVGTIWKSDFTRLTEPPRRDRVASRTGSHERGPATGADPHAAARSILRASYVDVIEMSAGLDTQEATTAAAVAQQDPRWATALAQSGDLDPIKVLASARPLLDSYHRPDDPAGGVVLATAVELLAIGHPEPIPADLLMISSRGLIPEALWPDLDPEFWFTTAIDWACRSVRGPEQHYDSIAPLRPHGGATGVPDGYTVPDLLIQEALRSFPEGRRVDLDVVLAHSSAEACSAIGRFFYFRDEDDTARPFLERAGREGVASAFHPLGYLTSDPSVAEDWYKKAVDSGDTTALLNFGYLLFRQRRNEEGENLFRQAIEVGDIDAPTALGLWLADQPGRESEAEELYRKGIAAGDPDAYTALGWLLARQSGRESEVEDLYREGIAAGDRDAYISLGGLLARQPGRESEAEDVLRQGIEAGDLDGYTDLGVLIARQPGRESEAGELFRQAVEAGRANAVTFFGFLLLGPQTVRETDSEDLLAEAATSGRDRALLLLQRISDVNPNREGEVERFFREANDDANADALRYIGLLALQYAEGQGGVQDSSERPLAASIGATLILLGWLASQRSGHEVEAEKFYREAIRVGFTEAFAELGDFLVEQPGREAEAEELYRWGVEAGDADAMLGLAELMRSQSGLEREAEELYREAIDAGNDEAFAGLGRLLIRQPGRDSETEELFRRSIVVGDSDGLAGLGWILAERPGCEGEAEDLYRRAIDAGDTDAIVCLALLLARQSGREGEAEELLRQALDAHADSVQSAADLLSTRQGREGEAEDLYRRYHQAIEARDAAGED